MEPISERVSSRGEFSENISQYPVPISAATIIVTNIKYFMGINSAETFLIYLYMMITLSAGYINYLV